MMRGIKIVKKEKIEKRNKRERRAAASSHHDNIATMVVSRK
jgi:hypothetical protein